MSEQYDHQAMDETGADLRMRKSMEDYRVEPRSGLWKDISRKLLWREILRFNFTNLTAKVWMVSAAGLLTIAAALYFTLGESHDASRTTGVPATEIPTAGRIAVTPAIAPAPGTTPDPAPTSFTVTRTRSVAAFSQPTPAAGNPVRNSLAETEARNTRPPESPAAQPAIAAQPEFSSDVLDLTLTRILARPARVLNPDVFADTLITFARPGMIFTVRKGSPRVDFFSAGLGFRPELARYTQLRDYSRVNFWLDGSLTYHFSRFSISTGAGFGYVFDEGRYRVDYKSHDSVGFYESVVAYSVGAGNEITYQTTRTTVYDSLVHMADPRANNRYTYLQIPLLLGYRFFETERLGLTFRTGPALLILLGTRKAAPEISYPNARILLVNEETPSRIQTGWQVWAGINLEYRMTRRMSFYAEPSFKYNLRSPAGKENEQYKAPWAVGLGLGIQYNIGKIRWQP